MDGVHENFLHMRYHEGTMQKTVECLRWMGDSELVSRRVHSRQNFFLMGNSLILLSAILTCCFAVVFLNVRERREREPGERSGAFPPELLPHGCAPNELPFWLRATQLRLLVMAFVLFLDVVWTSLKSFLDIVRRCLNAVWTTFGHLLQ